MEYVKSILKKHKANLQDKNKRLDDLIKYHKKAIKDLENESTKRQIEILSINQKIKAIEKDTYL